MTPELSLRQRQIIDLISRGKANKEIGFALGLTEGTVKEYVNRIFKKVHAANRVDLAVMHVRGQI